MEGFNVYVFILCLVVFVALTVFFATLITFIVKMRIKLVRGGFVDGEVRKQREKEAKKSAAINVLEKIITFVFLTVVIIMFFFSVSLKINENKPIERNTVKVVKSSSMSTKAESNLYLVENNLNNQIQMFDVVVVKPLPKESELKLYDIVVYEVDGQMIIHRIVDIKEPDETHSERRFVLQGDANKYSDTFPVLYSQMKGIYTGNKISYVGSFVVFMNSPAGWLCFILVIVVCLIYPFIDKKLRKENFSRYALIQGWSQNKEKQELLTDKSSESASFLEENSVTIDTGKDVSFMSPIVKTLSEKYVELSEEQKFFFNEIVAYASSIKDSKQIKNDRYEEYKYGGGRLVRVNIKRGIVVCEYLIPNDSYKRYVSGNKVKVKTAPILLKLTDKSTLQAAKDSIDIVKKNIDDEKMYKKEQAKLRRNERKKLSRGSGNE